MRFKVKALSLVQEYSCKEESHRQNNEPGYLELVWEEDGADDCCEHVGCGGAVLLHHVVELLKDSGDHEAPDAAKEKPESEEELDVAGGGGELGEDGAGEEAGGGDDVDSPCHAHTVQVQPELLLQEILTRVLKEM